ncbi:Peptidase M23B [Fulvimarina pelagi HTCC2506]|uniref:Peptidase M23B n=2 Tax=Fulvimarina pelagi TaxID=217511 RepID=Q0G112_9HYPH|nr:Peptidase M23B [Fulvimarina pelagi HTCC2506]
MVAGILALVEAASPGAAEEKGLGVPLDCIPGETCFLQQYADMDGGQGIADPFCGDVAYDGHGGTDVRVSSMLDVEAFVPVLAVAEGTVVATRDREPDAPVRDESEWPLHKGKECGNGAIVDHRDGLKSQYCHLRKGSVRVARGDKAARGAVIGAVGASGMAAFPHLHLTIRRGDQDIDPFSGKPVGTGCNGVVRDSLWSASAQDFFQQADVHVMAFGMAGRPPDYKSLMTDGPPPNLTARDRATIGWGWFLNLRKGDRLQFKITAPDGSTYIETETKPLGHRKAAYMQFVGRGRSPEPGDWTLEVGLKRDGEVVETKSRMVAVR